VGLDLDIGKISNLVSMFFDRCRKREKAHIYTAGPQIDES